MNNFNLVSQTERGAQALSAVGSVQNFAGQSSSANFPSILPSTIQAIVGRPARRISQLGDRRFIMDDNNQPKFRLNGYRSQLTEDIVAKKVDATREGRAEIAQTKATAHSTGRALGFAKAMTAAKGEKDKEAAIDAEVQFMMNEDDKRLGVIEPTATFAEIKPGILMDDHQELADMLRKQGFGKKTSDKEDEVIDPIGQAWRRCDLEIVINKLRAKYSNGKEASSKQAMKRGDEDLGAEIKVLWTVADAKFMKTVQARKDKVSSKEQAEKFDAMAESRFKIWFSREIIALEEMT